MQTTLVMAYERSESTLDNFGKFIHQLQLETKTLTRKLERILIKLYRQNVSLSFNQTHTQTHMYKLLVFYKRLIIYICMKFFIDVIIQTNQFWKKKPEQSYLRFLSLKLRSCEVFPKQEYYELLYE